MLEINWITAENLFHYLTTFTVENVHNVPSQRACLHRTGVFALNLESQNHRILECFGLEGTLRGHLVQPPWSEQGHLQLDQVAQSPVQPDLECFRGWGIYHLSGQPVPVFHHPHCKKCLPSVQSKSTLFEFKTITPCAITTGPAKKFVPVFLMSPL